MPEHAIGKPLPRSAGMMRPKTPAKSRVRQARLSKQRIPSLKDANEESEEERRQNKMQYREPEEAAEPSEDILPEVAKPEDASVGAQSGLAAKQVRNSTSCWPGGRPFRYNQDRFASTQNGEVSLHSAASPRHPPSLNLGAAADRAWVARHPVLRRPL